MADAEKREKVIRGLESCLRLCDYNACRECPYGDGTPCKLLHDALALLKEQEAVKPISGYGYYICGVCKNPLNSVSQKFCSECGKAVKWDAEP